MTDFERPISLLALVGSLRASSYSAAVLRALCKALPASVEINTAKLDAMPFYNADLDGAAPPEAVVQFRRQVADCDGVLVVTPEYNYGLPAVLKNAVDWASRPAYASVLRDKPVAYITISPGLYGGVRAQAHLQQLFGATLSRPVNAPQVAIAKIGEKTADGLLTDPDSLGFAMETVRSLIALIPVKS